MDWVIIPPVMYGWPHRKHPSGTQWNLFVKTMIPIWVSHMRLTLSLFANTIWAPYGNQYGPHMGPMFCWLVCYHWANDGICCYGLPLLRWWVSGQNSIDLTLFCRCRADSVATVGPNVLCYLRLYSIFKALFCCLYLLLFFCLMLHYLNKIK